MHRPPRALRLVPLRPSVFLPVFAPARHTTVSVRSSGLVRNVHASRPRGAKYERFGGGAGRPSGFPTPSVPPNGGGGGGGGFLGPRNPIVMRLRRRFGGDRGLAIAGVGLGGAGVYYVYHLERVPETGRLRFIDVSESQESAMGLQATQETLAQYSSALLSPLHPTSKRVREVARRVVESNGLGRMKDAGLMTSLPKISIWGGGEEDGWFGGNGSAGEGSEATLSRGGEKRKDIEWEVYVIKDDATKNAFVLPGGKIFVFTGILPVCKNDDGLASVLGHEVAHQVARHSAERMSSLKVLFVLGYVLEALGLDVGFSRLLLTFLLQLPNSRKAESEADHIGIHLMARACFDPRESSRMWTRMSESEKTSGMGGGAASVDFMSTHPANAKRIKALEKWMPEALDIRAASPCGDTTSQFEAFREHMPLGQTGRVWG